MIPTVLTSGGTTSGTTVLTLASVTPTSGQLMLLGVAARMANPLVAEPTVAGAGATWVVVQSAISTATSFYSAVYRARPSAPTTTPITVSFSATTVASGVWSLTQWSGVSSASTDGAGAIVQSTFGSPSTGSSGNKSLTLGAFASTANASYGWFGMALQVQATTGVGKTLLSDILVAKVGFGLTGIAEWQASTNTTVDAVAPAVANLIGAVAIELAASTVSTHNIAATLTGPTSVSAALSVIDVLDADLTGAASVSAALSVTDVLVASLVGAASVSATLSVGSGGLVLDGIKWARTPDTAVLDITGDIDLRAVIVPSPSWVGRLFPLFVKFSSAAGQRSYYFALNLFGNLYLAWTADGSTTLDATSTVTISAADGTVLALRATLDVNNGAGGRDVIFYTKSSTPETALADAASDSGWTQLGATVTTAGATSIFSSSSRLLFGGQYSDDESFKGIGTAYAGVVKNGIAGTVVANPDFYANDLPFTDLAGRAWNLEPALLVAAVSAAASVTATLTVTNELTATLQAAANASATLQLVRLLSASLTGAASLSASITHQRAARRCQMPSTGAIDLKILLTGLPEGGADEIRTGLLNTTATGNVHTTVLTTSPGTAIPIVVPITGRFVVIIPATTNTQTLRLAATTAETGIGLSSRGASVFSVPGASTMFLYSTPEEVSARMITW